MLWPIQAPCRGNKLWWCRYVARPDGASTPTYVHLGSKRRQPGESQAERSARAIALQTGRVSLEPAQAPHPLRVVRHLDCRADAQVCRHDRCGTSPGSRARLGVDGNEGGAP